jgi:hypothetical protein
VPVLGRMRVPADLLRDPLRLRRPAILLDCHLTRRVGWRTLDLHRVLTLVC